MEEEILTKKNKELWDETQKVLDEAYSELKNFENMALEKFRELAEIKNRIDKLCSRINDIGIKIIQLDRKEKQNGN